MTTLTPEQIKNELAHCTGTEHYYRYGLIKKLLLTDGAKTMAELCGAYWLLDHIVCYHKGSEFMEVFTLDTTGGEATITHTDGNDNNLRPPHKISFTDFPLPSITLWLRDGVILLPSEY